MDLTAAQTLIENPSAFGRAVGFTLLVGELHNDWIRRMISDGPDETLQAHRGSYKTTCVSIALSIIILLRPNDRTVFIRKTYNDVKEVIAQVSKILHNPFTVALAERIYGTQYKLTKDTDTEISTTLTDDPRGTSQLVGIGLGSSLTGKHFDRVFTDDIVNVLDRVSKAERERTKLIYQELQNIKNRGGRIFNTGTPWHEEDAFSIMPEPIKFDCYQTGLISPQELAEIKDSMLASLFAANYELRHIASEKVIFPDPRTGGDPRNVQQSNYCHIDAAYGGEDYTAFTICRKADGVYWVFGKLWHKHVDQCEDEIIELRRRFNAGKIWCEENADKGYLAKELRRRGERVATYWEDTNKFLKITSYLKGEWKHVVFVEGTDAEYIRQVMDYNEDAEHDDAPDSLASIVRILWGKRNENETYVPLYARR